MTNKESTTFGTHHAVLDFICKRFKMEWRKKNVDMFCFLYDEYDYIELEFDDTFLKMKTSIFLLPDFILGIDLLKGLFDIR